MSLTVKEVLENAEYNLKGFNTFQKEIGMNQLSNYQKAKELGANDEDDWSEWEEKIK